MINYAGLLGWFTQVFWSFAGGWDSILGGLPRILLHFFYYPYTFSISVLKGFLTGLMRGFF
jgi:hypothetical protein